MNARLRWGRRVPASVRRWAFLIVPAARRYHISANLIAAVMTMESNGDPLAWNASSDARGLMQILHGPWDPRANIFTGARMLARFLSEFHDLTLALAAYNAGPNAVIAAGGVPSFRETRDYVIVVRYLFDLYGNHPLTSFRRNLYRSTLRDLERFADARKKVRILARLAHISDSLTLTCRHLGSDCSSSGDQLLFQTGDPFWPIDDQPDPLSHTVPALP
jgi:hypothetical protein